MTGPEFKLWARQRFNTEDLSVEFEIVVTTLYSWFRCARLKRWQLHAIANLGCEQARLELTHVPERKIAQAK
jgi:hypothetical protein